MSFRTPRSDRFLRQAKYDMPCGIDEGRDQSEERDRHNYSGLRQQKGWQEAAVKEMLEAIADNPSTRMRILISRLLCHGQPPPGSGKRTTRRDFAWCRADPSSRIVALRWIASSCIEALE